MHTSSRFDGFIGGRLVLGAVAVAALSLSGCGAIAENLVEEGVERAVEADSGENVELDFNGENGMSIETDEGSMRIDEDGNFVIEGADGEVITGQSTDDGFSVTDENGDEVLNVDEDGGQIAAETEDGSFSAGSGVPAEWPGSIRQPTDLSDVGNTVVTSDGELLVAVTGTTQGSASEYFDSYASELEGDGYERTSYFESDGFRQGSYSSDDYVVNVVSDEDSSNIAVTVIASGE